MKDSLRHPYRRLQWKMMFPYILIIPLCMLLIEILIVGAAIVIIELFFMPSLVLYGDQQAVMQIRPFFVHTGMPDAEALEAWIRIPAYVESYQPKYHAVIDVKGNVLAATGSSNLPLNVPLQGFESSVTVSHLQQLLAGKESDAGIAYTTSDGSVIAIVPIKGRDNQIDGALFEDSGPGLAGRETIFWIGYYTPSILGSMIFFAIFSCIVSVIGGFYMARRFTRRFTKLVQVVDPWSKGDFSLFIEDHERDEIGQLAQQLNRMAEQLQNLLQTRQRLSSLEERNRLARDLHDSVKQHIFVAGLQVGAAKLQLGEREVATQQRLNEAEGIIQQVQQELATIIHEMRPVVLEEKGLHTALQSLAIQWSRQTEIVAAVEITGESPQSLPAEAEEALFRVTQEALANVVRHSRASSVRLQLVYTEDKVALTIADNGQGFDIVSLNGQGVGLTSMRERITAIGGEMHVESTVEGGTSVVVKYSGQHSIV